VQHVFTAVAINVLRIDAVLTQTPRGQTRRSPFARLVAHSDLQDAVGCAGYLGHLFRRIENEQTPAQCIGRWIPSNQAER